MDDKLILTGVLVDAETPISFVDVCQKYNLSEELLVELMEHGFIPEVGNLKQGQVTHKTLWRIQSACRLHHDLAINISGVVLALELLDELEQIRNELNILKHHVEIP